MNKKKVSLPVADVSGQTEHAKKTYVAPACSTVAVENEGCICVSVTLNPQGSSEPNTWGYDQVINGDHDEWFGSSTEVAPAKEQNGFWADEN